MTRSGDSSAWYEEWFDTPEYDLVYSRRDDDDARRLLKLVLKVTQLPAGRRVLDMACGRGRHSIQLARAGYDVTGIDLSPRAVDIARGRTAAESLEIEFRVGDMREAPCSGCFDMVVNLFTSFGYFDDDEQNGMAVAAMAESLGEGGWLVQDYMNGEYWSRNYVPFDERSRDGLVLKQRRWVDGNRLNKEITIVTNNGSSERRFTESVRLFGLDDFKRMYASAGVEIEQVFGDFEGRPFNTDSKRMIMFSRRSNP
jgi:SAM-dependent methyltransferase